MEVLSFWKRSRFENFFASLDAFTYRVCAYTFQERFLGQDLRASVESLDVWEMGDTAGAGPPSNYRYGMLGRQGNAWSQKMGHSISSERYQACSRWKTLVAVLCVGQLAVQQHSLGI